MDSQGIDGTRLSELVGRDVSTVSRILSGETPTSVYVGDICDALGIESSIQGDLVAISGAIAGYQWLPGVGDCVIVPLGDVDLGRRHLAELVGCTASVEVDVAS